MLGFLWSTIAYVMIVSNAVEVGENTRFQLYTEPLVVLLLAALAVAEGQRRGEHRLEVGPAVNRARTGT